MSSGMSDGSGPNATPTAPEDEELELEVVEPDGTRSRVICVAIAAESSPT